MSRTVIFVHGRAPKDLAVKEREWAEDLAPALGRGGVALQFASYADAAYGRRVWPGPVWLLYDFFRWFAPLPGREQRKMRFARPLADQLAAAGDGDVLLIAHSFGTILAYQHLVRTPHPGQKTWLVTIGSPLGWMPGLFLGFPKQAPPDSSVKRWANMYHLGDPVAGGRMVGVVLKRLLGDFHVADDYRAPSPLDPEQPVDWAIYHFEASPHDDNGYLTSRSVRNVVRAFGQGRPWPFDAITQPAPEDARPRRPPLWLFRQLRRGPRAPRR